jgi:hypothetical protein
MVSSEEHYILRGEQKMFGFESSHSVPILPAVQDRFEEGNVLRNEQGKEMGSDGGFSAFDGNFNVRFGRIALG